MVYIRAEREVAASTDSVWRAMVDWPAHGRWVPLTRVSVLTTSGEGVGARFVGRTGWGPLGFDDPMEVVEWVAPDNGSPGRCVVVKQGRWVLGRAWFTVSAAAGGGSHVVWEEEIEVWPVRLTRLLAPLSAQVGRFLFSRLLAAMAAEVESVGRRAA